MVSALPNFMVCKATVLQDYFYSSCMYKRLHMASTSALNLIDWHLYFFWHAVVFFRMLNWCKLSPASSLDFDMTHASLQGLFSLMELIMPQRWQDMLLRI